MEEPLVILISLVDLLWGLGHQKHSLALLISRFVYLTAIVFSADWNVCVDTESWYQVSDKIHIFVQIIFSVFD